MRGLILYLGMGGGKERVGTLCLGWGFMHKQVSCVVPKPSPVFSHPDGLIQQKDGSCEEWGLPGKPGPMEEGRP